MAKLLGFSTFLASTTLSVAALGAGIDDPAQHFIDRIIGEPSYSVVNSSSVTYDRTTDPAAAFLDRWAGKQTPAPRPSGVIDPGDPERDFIDRIAGVSAGYAKSAKLQAATMIVSWSTVTTVERGFFEPSDGIVQTIEPTTLTPNQAVDAPTLRASE